MKKILLVAAFVCTGVAFFASFVFADGGCMDEDYKAAAESMRKGKEAEKAGNLLYAYLYYTPDWCATEAMAREGWEGRKRIAKVMAKKAEAKGLFYSTDDIFAGTPDATCEKAYKHSMDHMSDPDSSENPYMKNKPLGLCDGSNKLSFNDKASAFAWYEGNGLFVEADDCVMKYARKNTTEYVAVDVAAKHFIKRKAKVGGEDALKEYKFNAAYVDELTGMARKNALAELETEKRVYNKVADMMTERLSPEALKRAKDWTLIFGDPLLETVKDTAVKRGDEVFLTQGDAPMTFMRVFRYYDIAERKDKEKTARDKAEKLGDKAEKAGEFVSAYEYYGLSGNKAKMNAVKPKAETENKKKGSDAVKKSKDSIDKIQKKDTDKKKFEKEADDLEKELGI
ncbi:MAG: hypothetical protein OEV59_10065 [Deltaproteobacteria bacterium]|nr:hypothetical protein [Deltaproteobacteria bacterium]